ncbi:hypothetical protein [Streptomyces sp. NPDC056672]|uniref:hypothetical protein n=1 Tax=Streptomyces sp. NPDC056672 TaxID=3345906 RepID=UPI003680D721
MVPLISPLDSPDGRRAGSTPARGAHRTIPDQLGGSVSNDQQSQEQIREALAQAGITVTGGITFGGSIVIGDQVGHSGGTVHGDVVLGNKTEKK